MFEAGLPVQFREPLSFLIDGTLAPAARQVAQRVERIRDAVAVEPDAFRVMTRTGGIRSLTPWEVAHNASINREWGTFLHLCARSFEARTILELGGCAGISGCYLASAESCERFVTVEGSGELAAIATANLGQVSNVTEVVNDRFDEALDHLLPSFDKGIDLVYIDGHHRYETTLHYLGRLTPHLAPGALVVFDDIRLTRGMWEAWRVVEGREGFALTVDAGRFGLAVRGSGMHRPARYDLSLYLGFLRRYGRDPRIGAHHPVATGADAAH